MTVLEIRNFIIRKKNSNPKITAKQVLLVKGVSTTFESGKLNAVMGPNGCGKTTMLTALYGTVERSTTTSGTILLDGKNRTESDWYNRVSIVYQKPYFPTNIRVRDALWFMLNLKNARCGTTSCVNDYNNDINSLYLSNLLDTKIDTLSGGEKQRVAILIEIIADKEIIILDEPTSELDSHLALNMIIYLRNLAIEKKKMIIFTIHQPSDKIMLQFDNILFMIGGRGVYSGPLDEIERYLSKYSILKPDKWELCSFLFEIFYNESSFKEISDQKEKITEFLEITVGEADQIVRSAKITNKSHKYITMKVEFGEFMALLKRSLKILFTSYVFYLKVLFLLVIDIGFTCLMVFRFDYEGNTLEVLKHVTDTITNDLTVKSNLLTTGFFDPSLKTKDDYITHFDHVDNRYVLHWILNEEIKKQLAVFFILFFNSDILSNLSYAETEMTMSYYSPLAFILMTFVLETIKCLILGGVVGLATAICNYVAYGYGMMTVPIIINTIATMFFITISVITMATIFSIFTISQPTASSLKALALSVLYIFPISILIGILSLLLDFENAERIGTCISLFFECFVPLTSYWIFARRSLAKKNWGKLNITKALVFFLKEVANISDYTGIAQLMPSTFPPLLTCTLVTLFCISLTMAVFTYRYSQRTSLCP